MFIHAQCALGGAFFDVEAEFDVVIIRRSCPCLKMFNEVMQCRRRLAGFLENLTGEHYSGICATVD